MSVSIRFSPGNTPYPDQIRPGFIDLLNGWLCMVCGANRTFDDIAVAHRTLVQLPAGSPPFHVRYCVDQPACVAYATAPGPWAGPPER